MTMKTKMNWFGTTTLVASAVMGLGGCASQKLEREASEQLTSATSTLSRVAMPQKTLAEQARPGIAGSPLDADAAAARQLNMAVARRATSPFIGSVMVPATTEDKLPSIFFEPYTLDFSDEARGGKVALNVAMARLSRLTSVPIRVQSDVMSPVATAATAQKVATFPTQFAQPGQPMPSPNLVNQEPARTAPLQPAGDSLATLEAPSIAAVEMKYQGTLAGYLNRVTDLLGLAWEFRDNTIVISRYVNELHEVFAMPVESRYSMSSSGAGSGGSSGGGGTSKSATSSIDVSERGEMNAIESVVKSITALVSEVPGSIVTKVDGTGHVLVKTSREMQSRVRDFVKTENTAMRRQANIQMDLYSITTDAGDERGINWSVILKKAGEAARLTVNSPAMLTSTDAATTTVSLVGGVAGNGWSDLLGNSTLFVQALASQGYTVQHRPMSLLAMNRQWARLTKMSTEYYLSETTPGAASTTGVGAPGLKTDKVTTGDQYVALPQILDDNTVLLRFAVSLSDLLGLFDVSVGSGSTMQKVQAPKLTATDVQMPVAIKPGEIVMVTGMSRQVASSNNRRLAEDVSVMFGGSSKVSKKREHFILFVRPTLIGV